MACKKAKSRKKDAGTGKKLASLKYKRHAKKQNREKGMPKPGKSRQPPKYKRHVKINKIINNMLRYK